MTSSPVYRRGGLDVHPKPSDVLFFSHLRWDFVFQRPQHIASRWAAGGRAFFWEEPKFDAVSPELEIVRCGRVERVIPHLPEGPSDPTPALRVLLDGLCSSARLVAPVGWYWTPMMRPHSRHLQLSAVVWDCMDELSSFAFAPPDLALREVEMLADADLVFTGGAQLYQSKRGLHPAVHPFPSGVDVGHFQKARTALEDPEDQSAIPRPRLGWFGVIDERTDLALLEALSDLRPGWQIVMVGPVVKIPVDSLPRRPNLHWLGMKSYAELPSYIAGWDVAILPFALNEATRFISPTKTPEYLAAGRTVVSTPITDVIHPYGVRGLVRIASGAEAFAAAVEQALGEDPTERQAEADALLAEMSWDVTVRRMQALVDRCRRTSAVQTR